MGKVFIFLVLPLIFLEVQGLSKFNFHGNLGCKLHKFCYHIEIYEEDFLKKSDDLLKNQTEVISIRPHKYSVSAQDTDDGLDFLRKFEIYMVIYHTCTSVGKKKRLRYDWGKFDIDVGESYNSKDLELFNLGEDV